MKLEKELSKLLKPYLKQGWRLECNKHYKLFHPCGQNIVISTSSSCPHYVKNVKTDIEKLIKSVAQK